MPGFLLITWKNGRPVKTYGVNQRKICNMKFTFICIVIAVSCSVGASGDLEIYPGLKFNFDSEKVRSRLQNYDDQDFFPEYESNAWKDVPLDGYGDIEQKEPVYNDPESMRQIDKIYNWGAVKLNRHGNRRSRFKNIKHWYDFEDLQKPAFKNFGLGFPNPSNLDDVRMYPQEDDFSFNNEDIEDDIPDDIPKIYYRPDENDHDTRYQENPLSSTSDDIRSIIDRDREIMDMTQLAHNEEKLTSAEEFPTGAFGNVKVMDDPTEFAYAPPDQRFYEKPEALKTDKDTTQQSSNKLTSVEASITEDELSSKNDKKPPDYDEDNEKELTVQGINGEVSRNGGLDVIAVKPNLTDVDSAGVYIIAIVAGISAAATVGLIAVGIGWYKYANIQMG